MVMHTASIREFVEPALVCLHTAALSEAIELFEAHNVDRLVIVNEQQHPIGLIYLRRLLPYLRDNCSLRSLLNADILEELPYIAEACQIEEIEFPKDAARHWAVVNAQREFLGLVDSFYLRKLLDLTAQVATDAEIQTSDQKEELPVRRSLHAKPTSESLWHQAKADATAAPEAAQINADLSQLKQRLQVQIAELGYANRAESGTARLTPTSPIAALHWQSKVPAESLMQVLERLPLPLMLQTNTGDVIAQNALWNEQFGELTDPDWIQRDAAAILEYVAPSRSTATSRYQFQPFQPSALPRLCEIGSTPNTCICVCPLKNGQERILQLVKIPLGSLLPERELDLTQLKASVERSFRLATIDGRATPDPVPVMQPAEESLWLVLAQDVTEQQQLSRELAAKNADLVQLNRLKDEFLACISHELRTPLTAVLGLSSLLKDQLSGSMNERQVRYAQLIYRSGRHLMAIVNDILDLTRIETGQLELSFAPVKIRSMCDRAFEQAQQLSLEEEKPEAKSALAESATLPQFTLDIEPGLDSVVADELRLRQMLINLLSNALKFTESSGKIGLTVNHWEGWVAFTIWDTGIGIPAEKQHLIFQKFQQLENPLTRRFEGAGLGLVLTQRLARLHGGDISFVSQENQGSQFTLLLPPTHPEPTLTLGSPTALRTAANRLVLVVEAVVKSIETLSEQLTGLGYRVVIARSGTEAVEKARRLQPCAVLLNPLLPTLSGWDVLTLLKAEPETRQIPVIITGTRGDKDQAYRNQADGFLSLPIVSRSLKLALNQLATDEIPVLEVDAPAASLVILRLSPTRYGDLRHVVEPEDAIDLNALLHSHNYRVIEADDLEQAELLAQVWKPNVVLLDAAIPDPLGYLKLLGERTFLASLPLVTLDPITTQAANQIPGLSVFPCLAPLVEQSISSGQSETSALLQVIQVAAGFAWRPMVLAIGSASLHASSEGKPEWLQAVMQYLQTAGFRGTIARSGTEIMQKVQAQSVDLLLIHWSSADPDEATLGLLSELKQIDEKPPIVVIKSRHDCDASLLDELAIDVLPPVTMEELLSQINHILTE